MSQNAADSLKNHKQTEQQIVKTLLEQPQQQQQQYNKMPPLEYATLTPTRVQYLHEQQKITPKITTTTTITKNISHLPNCKYHAINQQQQQQQYKICQHQQQQQHHKSCQHSSPQQQHHHHHHHHHHHQHQRQHKSATLQQAETQQPVYHHHTLNLHDSKNRRRDYTIKTQHYKSSPEINRSTTSPPTNTTANNQLWLSLPRPVPNKKAIRRSRSYYNSFDDLDAKTRAEKRVVASLKYLCACTGATIRNLSKKTKNLHATQQQFTFTYAKPTWRHWGEEREKDAIFTVYLKKVRYHRPTPSVNNDSDDDISHLEWETVRVRFVKAATLARLVEALATVDGELESTFINVFLSTYRTFSTPKEVLNLLMNRYDELHDKHMQELAVSSTKNYHHHNNNNKNNNNNHNNINNNLTRAQDLSQTDCNMSIPEQHKKTLVSALHVWLDGFPEDWTEEQLRQLLAFAAKRLPRSELHVKVLKRLERILRQQMYHERSYADVVDLTDDFHDLCLAPAFRGPTHILHAFRFPHVPVRHFAEQLTRMDSELFKRLIPHQCLGATWARRDKADCETVVATINQFNAVLFRVISSILIEPRLKPQDRALNIATWIDIAQELRLLKNFSSLKAIISGLQSNSIYRLSKIWAVLPKEKMEIFNELARIFSEDNNAWAQREVLMREGTAKFADTVGEHDRHLQKIIQKQSTQTSHGTIPYLGTFLTDLTMIHTAIPDTIEAANGDTLINFDKKRKEFEVLAQIKLLQGAANTYNLRDDPHFDRWFASMLVLDEREAHNMSCHLESPPAATRKSRSMHNYANNSSPGHRKTDSMTSNSSSGAGSQFYCDLNNSTSSHFSSSRQNSLDRDGQLRRNQNSMLSASSSVSNLSLDSSNSGGQKSNYTPGRMSHSQSAQVTANCDQVPLINAQLVQSAHNMKSNQAAPDFYIIRVTYETDNVEMDGIVLYKSIMLGNNERTPQVIRNAMLKLGLEADPEQWTLAQVLPDKELVMPRDANVYYAVNTNYNLNFILRPIKKA